MATLHAQLSIIIYYLYSQINIITIFNIHTCIHIYICNIRMSNKMIINVTTVIVYKW